MNIAKTNTPDPGQDTMLHAQFRQNIYPYYYPFIPMDEQFRRVSDYLPEYRDYYWISNYGRLYNANSGYLCTPTINEAGYTLFNLRRTEEAMAAGRPRDSYIGAHILVCTCFVGPKPGPKHQVNHRDFRRSNNYYQNLEWTTPQENLDYSRAAGNYWNGNVYSSARYSEEQVRAICELLQAGITDPPTICMQVFGCEPNPGLYSLIRQIKSGKNWSQVSKDYEGIGDVEHRNFTNDNVIHVMCHYMKDHPATAYTACLEEILAYGGLYLNQFTDKEHRRFASALHQLRYKNAYRRIADLYGIPRQ